MNFDGVLEKKKGGVFSSLKNAFSGKSSKKEKDEREAENCTVDDQKETVEGAAGESSAAVCGQTKEAETKAGKMEHVSNSGAQKEEKVETANPAQNGNLSNESYNVFLSQTHTR